MADFLYTIALTSSGTGYGGLSGPYYTVTYTTASVYNSVISGSPVYLPSVGSTANVTIPSGSLPALSFKLTSSGSCTNEVIYVVI